MGPMEKKQPTITQDAEGQVCSYNLSFLPSGADCPFFRSELSGKIRTAYQ